MAMLVKTSLSYWWQMSKMMACTDELKVAPFTSQPQVTPGRQRSWGHRDKPWEAAARQGQRCRWGEVSLYLRISLNLAPRYISQPCTLGRTIPHSLIFLFISHWDVSQFSTFMFILQAFRDTIFHRYSQTELPKPARTGTAAKNRQEELFLYWDFSSGAWWDRWSPGCRDCNLREPGRGTINVEPGHCDIAKKFWPKELS